MPSNKQNLTRNNKLSPHSMEWKYRMVSFFHYFSNQSVDDAVMIDNSETTQSQAETLLSSPSKYGV